MLVFLDQVASEAGWGVVLVGWDAAYAGVRVEGSVVDIHRRVVAEISLRNCTPTILVLINRLRQVVVVVAVVAVVADWGWMVTVEEVGMVQVPVVGLEVLSMRKENQASRLWSGMYVFFFLEQKKHVWLDALDFFSCHGRLPMRI
jgi:hypothetical protein